MRNGRKRSIGHGLSIVDPPEVDVRTLTLAIRRFGPSTHFTQQVCSGVTRERNGKRYHCYVAGHGPRCKGKPYWQLATLTNLPAFGPTANVHGTGATPKKALRHAITRARPTHRTTER